MTTTGKETGRAPYWRSWNAGAPVASITRDQPSAWTQPVAGFPPHAMSELVFLRGADGDLVEVFRASHR